jgi:hypothetical protein
MRKNNKNNKNFGHLPVHATGLTPVLHFVADPDLRIRTFDKWIRLLSSMTLRIQKKFFFIFFSYNLPAGTLFSVEKITFFAKILC